MSARFFGADVLSGSFLQEDLICVPMVVISPHDGGFTEIEQAVVAEGFRDHNSEHAAPEYAKKSQKWLVRDDQGVLVAALSVDVCWDWMYVDELWVSSELRGSGLGRRLMCAAEECARLQGLQGIWLWTQSWQAAGFYSRLGYQEFCRFPNFPKGHERIGFRSRFEPTHD
ncbi:GNAT family N-acetyltransferase [Oceaniferula marina]|nr:GNAT family N-acetyltransferase [Oceaniferula marina]